MSHDKRSRDHRHGVTGSAAVAPKVGGSTLTQEHSGGSHSVQASKVGGSTLAEQSIVDEGAGDGAIHQAHPPGSVVSGPLLGGDTIQRVFGRQVSGDATPGGDLPSTSAGSKSSLVASRYPALRKALRAAASGAATGDNPTIHDAATVAVENKGTGQPVEEGVASRVGAHLGADFSNVRVHGDSLAREATSAMGARAFAHGSDVFLGPGESGGDLGLMAHELTHVAQQGAAGRQTPQRAVTVGDENSPAERQADQVASSVTSGQGRPAALLVDEGPAGPGQMLKSQFLEQLRAAVTAAADAELGPIYSAVDCPYIAQYFGRYAGEPASAGEAVLRRFAPATRTAQAAMDMIPAVVARVREGVREWRDTGKAPADLPAITPEGSEAAGSAGTPGEAQALRAPGGGATLASLEAELGPGQPLGGATANRMSDALGVDVSSARIHTGPVAARKAADAGALAFAVGGNVVMGAGAPSEGTLEGDALLAHELTHTAQQAGAATDPVARRRPIGGESPAAEEHADAAAAGALAQLHGGARDARGGLIQRLGGAMRTGLQLQRCEGEKKKAPAPVPAPAPAPPAPAPAPKHGIDPEDVASEMIGKDFEVTKETTIGGTKTPAGTVVVPTAWDNAKHDVPVKAKATGAVLGDIPKASLLPVRPGTPGMHEYSAGAKAQAAAAEKADRDLAAWDAKEGDFKKNHTEWKKEHDRLAATAAKKHEVLNRKLIQEEQLNRFDPIIKAEVDAANKSHGLTGADALDPNLVKAMIFQESQMGTSGQHLEIGGHKVKTRFNLGQAIDSSANNLLLLLEKEQPALITKYHLADARKDLADAQRKKAALEKKGSARTPPEDAELAELQRKSGHHWETFLWEYRAAGQAAGLNEAIDELFSQTGASGNKKNEDYQFWIHTLLVWLYDEKKKPGMSWEEAIRAYNGAGPNATSYKNQVVGRRDAAKTADKSGKDFVPGKL
jgi:hypothetical protein